MPTAISSVVSGLYASVAKATQATCNIVNASSTGGDFDSALINLQNADSSYTPRYDGP